MDVIYNPKYSFARSLVEYAHYNQKYANYPGPQAYFVYHLSYVDALLVGELLETRITGLTHDLLEDTGIKYDTILEFFGPEIAGNVATLTRHYYTPDEPYIDYILRVNAGNEAVRKVKLADATRNLEVSLRTENKGFVQRYYQVLQLMDFGKTLHLHTNLRIGLEEVMEGFLEYGNTQPITYPAS